MKNIHQINDNIYIANDEEIKEGDYFWKPDCNMIFKAEYTPHKGCQKIILTTDQDLIADGVQEIDDEFLEWFVKNPSCEELKVEKDEFYSHKAFIEGKNAITYDYKIIIPKDEAKQRAKNYMSLKGALETNQIKCYCGHTTMCDCSPLEEPTQETLEEVKDLDFWKNNAEEDYLKVPLSVLRYISELERQQERSYSEQEFLCFSEWVSSEDWVYLPSKGYWVNEEQEELEQKFTTKQLFEQFKKK
jgi:hypothetical protein